MSQVMNTDDRPQDKSLGNYPASNKKNPPKSKDKQKIHKGRMHVDNRSTLSLMGHTGVGDNSAIDRHEY